MAQIKAVNKYVWVLRDEIQQMRGGLILPSSGQVKPHTGLIHSCGKMVADPEIKKGKKAIWHQHVGQEIEYDGVTYTVLPDEQIIGVE